MLITAKKLEGIEVRARDGAIGKVEDIYFDDLQWHVRYLVVDAGSWLSGRKVLISSGAVSKDSGESKNFLVDLTREQVRNGPDIDTAKPVSRQHEEQLHRHFAWPYYWSGPYVGGGVNPSFGGPSAPTPSAVEASRGPFEGNPGETLGSGNAQGDAWREAGDDPHLRSVSGVRDYHIESTNGSIGHVEDFVIDDTSWTVRYFLIDTKNWLRGKKVIVPPQAIRKVSWLESSVIVDLTREAIESGPEIDESRPLTADYTDRLDAHYRRYTPATGGSGDPRLRRQTD